MLGRVVRLACAAVLLTVGTTGLAWADQIAQAKRIADEFAAPRYAALARATAEQATMWTALCAAPTPDTTTTLRAAFTKAVLAWEDIALLRTGPIAEDNRLERLSYWPDKRNITDKRLRELLGGNDPVPDIAAMAGKSVAVQGFHALERVLFADGPPALETPDGARRCAVGALIARNIAAIAGEVDAPWQDATSALRVGLTDKEGAETFLRRAATDLIAGYEILIDDKIRQAIGREADAARPLSAEFRRSGLSLPAIRKNIASLRALTAVMLAGTDDENADATAAEALKLAIGASDNALQATDDPSARTKMLLLVAALTSARDIAKEVVPDELGVTIGFNSADGD